MLSSCLAVHMDQPVPVQLRATSVHDERTPLPHGPGTISGFEYRLDDGLALEVCDLSRLGLCPTKSFHGMCQKRFRALGAA